MTVFYIFSKKKLFLTRAYQVRRLSCIPSRSSDSFPFRFVSSALSLTFNCIYWPKKYFITLRLANISSPSSMAGMCSLFFLVRGTYSEFVVIDAGSKMERWCWPCPVLANISGLVSSFSSFTPLLRTLSLWFLGNAFLLI